MVGQRVSGENGADYGGFGFAPRWEGDGGGLDVSAGGGGEGVDLGGFGWR